jgi:hypothetical protein
VVEPDLTGLPDWEPAHVDAARRIGRQLRGGRPLLHFAVGADQRLQDRLATELGGAVLRLDPSAGEPWSQIESVTAPVRVVGVPKDASSAFLTRLNLGRERVQQAGLQVILWLEGLEMVHRLAETAPDLWAHRGGLDYFLSEADLPPPPGDDTPNYTIAAQDLQSRISTWPTHYRQERLHLQAILATLLFMSGRQDAAARLHEATVQALQGALDDAHAETIEILNALRLLHPALPRILNDRPRSIQVLILEHVAALGRSLQRGKLDEVDRDITETRRIRLDESYAPLLHLYLCLLQMGLALRLSDPRGFEAAIRSHQSRRQDLRFLVPEGFPLPDVPSEIGLSADLALLQGDWLPALRALHAAAPQSPSQPGLFSASVHIERADLACQAGLVGVARRCLRRGYQNTQPLGLTARVDFLARALRAFAGRPSRLLPLAWLREAQALHSSVHVRAILIPLLAALGLVGHASLARQRLSTLARRNDYDGHRAALGLARLELDLHKPRAACAAAHRALVFAQKHGGYALIAEVWLLLATAARACADSALQDEATQAAEAQLLRVEPRLRPPKLRLDLARERAALLQAQGQGAKADALFAPLRAEFHERGLKMIAHETLLAAARFGGPGRVEAAEAAIRLAWEVGLPILEARALLERAALPDPPPNALEKARWWIEQIGERAELTRLAEVQRAIRA